MNVTLIDSDEGKMELRVEADWPEVRADYEDLLAEYMKAPLPGFRPGRAPRHLVERRHRKSLHEDLAVRCGQRLSRAALEDRGVSPAGSVALTEYQVCPGERFTFTARFEPCPDFALPDYRSLRLRTESDAERRDEVSEWLLTHVAFDPPAGDVQEELDFCGAPGGEPDAAARQAAARRVKLTLILRRIAEADGISVDERDVDERIEAMAAGSGVRAQDLRRELRQKGGLARLSALMLAERTLDYLIELAVEGEP